MMLFCFVNVRERVVVKDEAAGDKVPLKKALPALFKNKILYLIILILRFICNVSDIPRNDGYILL